MDANVPYVVGVDDLDDLALIHIFAHLPITDRLRVERVCKRWQCLVRESFRKLKTLNFDTDFHSDVREHTTADSGALQKVLQLCGNSLKCLTLTSSYPCNDVLANIHAFCPKIEIINGGYYLEPRIMSKIGKNLTNLTSFKARGQSFRTRDGDSLAEIFDRNRNLSTLALHSCYFTAESFSHLNHEILETLDLSNDDISELQLLVYELKKFKKLRHFSLDTEITSISDFNLLNSLLTANNWKTVKMLHLTLMIDNDSILYANNLLLYINHFKELEDLDIYAGSFVDDKILLSIAQKCTKLKKIKLSDSNRITNVGLTYISDLLKIENLELVRVNVSGKALSNMKSLKVLKCAMCPRIENGVVIKLIETSENLKTIELANCSGLNLESLTDSMKRICREILEVKFMIGSRGVLTVHTLSKVGNRLSKKTESSCSKAFINKTNVCNGNCTDCTQVEIRYIE